MLLATDISTTGVVLPDTSTLTSPPTDFLPVAVLVLAFTLSFLLSLRRQRSS